MLRNRITTAAMVALPFGLSFAPPATSAPPPPETGVALPPPSVALDDDPVLRALLEEARQKRPELAQARSLVEAERERVPQAGALPDPVLSMGLQNDGFRSLQIGQMETSWAYFMASQSVPWFGKRALRASVAEAGVHQAEAQLDRTQLAMRAEIERAYLDLLATRDQLELLGRLEALWTQAEGAARTRYETGDGAQSDLLRAQLERIRLRQRRLGLQAEEHRRVAVLNRLRGHPTPDDIPSSRHLTELLDPPLPSMDQALADAEARSPELQDAQHRSRQAQQRSDLAHKEYWPDLTFTAGVMPRGGSFETMWTAGLSFSVPVWAASKQARAVAEERSRQTAAAFGADTVRRLLHQRVRERMALLQAAVETNRLYRSGLLVQSDATVSSTLAQYRVGRVPFASVLEALSGYVSDVDGFLLSIAGVQRLAIAARELSLDSPAGIPEGAGFAPVPGAGAGMGPSSGGAQAGPFPVAAGASAPPSGQPQSMSRM